MLVVSHIIFEVFIKWDFLQVKWDFFLSSGIFYKSSGKQVGFFCKLVKLGGKKSHIFPPDFPT